jgi:threonine 3-dehydrogenase
MSQERILVTGGSGFLGKPVCEFLINMGFQVTDISLKKTAIPSCHSIQADISKMDELESVFSAHKMDAIIHLAALLHTASWNNPAEAYRVNVQGSYNLLELARKYNLHRFVFGSTVDALGFHPANDAVDEAIPVSPTDLYGETKRFVENLGLAYREIYGLEFISARIPFLVGPGCATPTSAWRMDIFNRLKTGGEIDFGFEADTIIPMADIRDSALEICALATAEKPRHSIYNLPCESIRMVDLAHMVQHLGQNIQIKFGNRKGDFYPSRVDFNRFQEEYGLTHTPLEVRLEQHALNS